MFASSLEPASVRQVLLNRGERIQLGPIFSLIATGRESQLPAGSLTQAKSLVATLRSFEGPSGSLVASGPSLGKGGGAAGRSGFAVSLCRVRSHVA